MRKILIIEDQTDILCQLLNFLNPIEYGESYEPNWDITIMMTEETVKESDIDPGLWDYVLIDHDLPNRGNGGRILNWWVSNFGEESISRLGTSEGIGKGSIIAISCVPVNNERLINLGCNLAINKMDDDWLSQLKKALGE